MATRDSSGGIDGIFVHAMDVTDGVNARIQVEESEARYRFLAESIPQMVWTATPDGALDYVSGQVASYFGTTVETLVGDGWLAGVHPEDQPGVLERWQQSLATGEPYEAEFRLRRGEDAAWRWFLVRARSMSAPEGKVLRWTGTCTDIHDQKESEAALRRVNRELEEFAYVASHDLQEPLRMVSIYTQLILKQVGETHHGGDDATLSLYTGFVKQGTRRMEALIRDLLTFSRTVHTDELSIGTADLSESLREALNVLRNRIDESGAAVNALPLPKVRGETAQMAHVFQNVVSNALKYRRSDLAPRIHISAEAEGNNWVVSIRDNGIGFEQQYAERIFGLFKRLHKEEYPGTGLGLAICKRIVERYGGCMWAEGKPGEGATFRFTLPRMED
jgi:PAS domain S-box-containing protein